MSGYLLDTAVFLLSASAPERLNRKSRTIVENAKSDLLLSAASSWEIAIKYHLGKLRLPEPAFDYVPKRLTSQGIRSLAITQLHALIAGRLPDHHNDPFDRMLIAQAQIEKLVLMTTDSALRKYDVEMVWCG